MTTKELDTKVAERQKRIFHKRTLINVLLLLPPTLALQVLLVCAISTYSASLFLIYFILPMFYTVEKRICYDVSGIGKPDYTYADGYKAFFNSSQGGIFGVIISIVQGLMLIMLFYLLLQLSFGSIVNCFPEASSTYNDLITLVNNQNTTYEESLNFILAYGGTLSRPLTIVIGLIAFAPVGFVLFFGINSNLDNHYLCTIVLPDIDKNISSSQARSLSKGSFGRLFTGTRLAKTFKYNWPYYVAFTVIYGLLLYGFSFLQVNNAYLLPILVSAVPALSIFFAIILDYFCLFNEYCIIEEGSPIVLERMPSSMKDSIYQTYCSKHYVHGEESAIRGCFVPGPTFNEANPFSSPFENADNTPKASAPKPEEDKPEEQPTGVVIDLTKDEHKDNK
ncbi:MAG: hypothetical protein WCR56_00955 [Bacilli bacterium]|jgi:hypothetical protein